MSSFELSAVSLDSDDIVLGARLSHLERDNFVPSTGDAVVRAFDQAMRVDVRDDDASLSTALSRLGLVGLSTDASTGDVSTAIKVFQAANALPVDGRLGDEDALELAMHLGEIGTPQDEITQLLRSLDLDLTSQDVRWPVLAVGMSKSLAVRLAQLRLNAIASAGLVVDGDFGPATRRAVRAFQQSQGIDVDGVVGEVCWVALMASTPVLVQGQRGDLVRTLQLRLSELHYGSLGGTGYFGPKTLSALHEFMGENGVPMQDAVTVPVWRNLMGGTFAHSDEARLLRQRAELRRVAHEQLHRVPSAQRDMVQAVLDAAISTYGIHERPARSNRGPELDALVGTRGWAWCALAVSAWLKRGLQAAAWAEIPFGREQAAVNSIRHWGAVDGRFITEDVIPPGAILIINREGVTSAPQTPFGKGHTGLVLADTGDEVQTIEGNSMDAVRSVVHRKNDRGVVGFVRWW